MLIQSIFDHLQQNPIPTDSEIVCEMGVIVYEMGVIVYEMGVIVCEIGVFVCEMGISCARWGNRVRDGHGDKLEFVSRPLTAFCRNNRRISDIRR